MMAKSDHIGEKMSSSLQPSEHQVGQEQVQEEEEPKEITVRVVVLSVVLAIVLGSANVYLGLFAGNML
jgi:hypothetical protein